MITLRRMKAPACLLAVIIGILPGYAWAQTPTISPCVVGQSGSGLGQCMANAGDVNHDGTNDIIAGAAGYAYVLDGANCSVVLRNFREPQGQGKGFGFCVAGLGDINGDGFADVAVGCEHGAQAYIFLGSGDPPSMEPVTPDPANPRVIVLSGDAAIEGFGSAIARLGHLDGDENDDFAVGSPGEDMVYVFSGKQHNVIVRIKGLQSAQENDKGFGQSLWGGMSTGTATAPDLLIGAPDYERQGQTPGRVYMFIDLPTSGKLTAKKDANYVIEGPPGVKSGFGSALDWSADITGDGINDIVIGAPHEGAAEGADVGQAYLVKSLPSGSQPVIVSAQDGNHVLVLGSGAAAGDNFSSSIAVVGDVDGDGGPDVAIGAPNDHGGGADAGAVYVFSADDTSASLIRTFTGEAPSRFLGRSLVARACDGRNGGLGLALGEPAYGYQNSHDGRVVTVCLQGGAAAPAGCRVEAATANFGYVVLGQEGRTSLVIHNDGAATLTGAVSASCPDFEVVQNGGNFSILPAQSLAVELRFKPSTPGVQHCVVGVSVVPGGVCANLLFDGVGVSAADCCPNLDQAYHTGSPGTGRIIQADQGALEVQGSGGIAVGDRNKVGQNRSLAVGTDNEITGEQSIAVGTSNHVASPRSGAFGESNTISGAGDNFAFGKANQIENSTGSGIGSGDSNRVLRSANSWISGGRMNTVDSSIGSHIGGGENQTIVDSGWSTIGGGAGNTVRSSTCGTVSGGRGNTVESADQSAIGGGASNVVRLAPSSVVAGGDSNSVDALAGSVIGGGSGNRIDTSGSQIARDRFNTPGKQAEISDYRYSTIAGGRGNRVNVGAATIGGGADNVVDTFGYGGSIGGGRGNRVSGWLATVSGGLNNVVRGDYATVPGGADNRATGEYSFASGHAAKARGDGAFVWADAQSDSFVAARDNEFLIRAAGGVGIGTSRAATNWWDKRGEFMKPGLRAALSIHYDRARFRDGLLLASDNAPPSIRLHGLQGDPDDGNRQIPMGYGIRQAGRDLLFDRRAQVGGFPEDDSSYQHGLLVLSLPHIETDDSKWDLSDPGGDDPAFSLSSYLPVCINVESGYTSLHPRPALRVEHCKGHTTDYLQVDPDDVEGGTIFVIDKKGNCGIGNKAPLHKLDVNGDVCATNVNCPSDERYKRDVHGIDSALEKTLQLRGVNFQWRSSDFPGRHCAESPARSREHRHWWPHVDGLFPRDRALGRSDQGTAEADSAVAG
ncbi:MAG: FG-GAP repeat protein [candidate division Zixibacteria bacterium]|nr:FG-GAP repeat protein [candidate division Zixibacteria bacterium]